MLLGLSAGPARAAAQAMEWEAAAMALFDTRFSGRTEVGPGLALELMIGPGRPMSYFVLLSVARTDFPVAPDDLHRNYGAAALGIRFSRPVKATRVGFTLGLGMSAWDDISETDPGFRSSADAAEMLIPGLEIGIPLGSSLRTRLSVRDQITGWWDWVLDPGEGRLGHGIVVSLGLGTG